MKQFRMKKILLIVTYAIALYFIVMNWRVVFDALAVVLRLMSPFFYGFVIAYLLNGPFLFFKNKVFGAMVRKGGMAQKVGGVLAVTVTYLITLAVITAIFWVVIPEIGKSIGRLIEYIVNNADAMEESFRDFLGSIGLEASVMHHLQASWNDFVTNIGTYAEKLAPHVFNFAKGLTTGVYNWLIGIIVSIYLLASRDKLLRQMKKATMALVPQKRLSKVMEIAALTNQTFGKFIIGRIIDSAIVLVLCYICMLIFQMPYALLISVVVGVTNVIPIFGPFIGAIPSAFILLMVDPIKCIWFIVFIIILQQIDGNVIGPRVVGNSIGLSGIWVMFGVIVGGGLFGVTGMLVGVPILAVIYTVMGDIVNNRLKKRRVNEGQCAPAVPAESAVQPGSEE